MLNILGEQGLAHARTILETQGRIRYLKDWDADITDHIKGLTIRPGSEPVIDRFSSTEHRTVPYRLAVTHVPASRGRRFDYAKLKANEPTLYQRNVTVTAADSPLTLTFPRAAVWNELRSVGWQAAFEEFEDAKAGAKANLTREASTLSNIRGQLRDLASREKVERIAMAELISVSDRTIRPYTYRDGLLRVSRSGLRQSIDLDLAERHPELRKYIAYTDTKPYTKVWFQRAYDED